MHWLSRVLFALVTVTALPARAAEISALDAPELPLGGAAFLMGDVFEMRATLAPALFAVGDTVIAVTDRGPVAPCTDPGPLTGADAEALCGGSEDGIVFANVDYAPMIHQLTLSKKALSLDYALPLKGAKEEPVTGRPPLFGDSAPEPAYTAFGEAAPFDPSGVDPAGIVRLSDHSYLIAESYGPSVLEVRVDGAILRRHVPKGRGEALSDAPYPVSESLPKSLIGARAAGLALHDGAAWLVTQTGKGATLTEFDAESGKAGRTVAYKPGKGAAIAGVAATPSGALILMERAGKGWSLKRATIEGKTAKAKTLVTSAKQKKAPARVAGFTLLDKRTLLLVEDDAYGLGKSKPARFVRLTLDEGALD